MKLEDHDESGNRGDGPKNLMEEILGKCVTQPDTDIEVVQRNANPVIVDIEESNNLGMTSDHTSLSSLTDSLPNSAHVFIGTVKDVELVDSPRSCGECNESAIAKRSYGIHTDKHILQRKLDSETTTVIGNDEQCNVKSDQSVIDLTEVDDCKSANHSVVDLIGDDESKLPASDKQFNGVIDLTK